MSARPHKRLGGSTLRARLMLLAVCAILLAPARALAHDYLHGDLQVIHPAIPALAAPGGPWPVHMVIANDGAVADRLLAIETEFGPVRLRRPNATGGSDALAWLALPPGETVVLTTGETEGWIAEVPRALIVGEQVSGTLVFERAGRLPMVFLIDPAPETAALPVAIAREDAGAPDAGTQRDPGEDIVAIAAALSRATSGDARAVAPVVLQGDVALAGFRTGEATALAFLRFVPDAGWHVVLWSNDSLLLPASLIGLGVSRPAAERLISEARARIDAAGGAFAAALGRFPGTAYPSTPD
ncbi:copper chaperone PCu(A)C [Microvirga tunisiensis]|uniref:Copper chaperone PCu(A)C n=1 Tax=Pannonibacter tanglangensis TaxID=2750084 RepID=A0A7X5J8A6_9HYPH|nr:copper chaperone PCu(A)C [Pannonibacter sp. XCT-53]NBN77682.1 copper chaperone PCu(A)C [Pannonibacter sp. XCT-53]